LISSKPRFDGSCRLRETFAGAHDHGSAASRTAGFQALPGSSFTVTGAPQASDLLLATASAEVWLNNRWSFAAWFDGEFADHGQLYSGTGRLRYEW
jgi:uncharacterized protein with beta-barrel porin domain